MGVGVRRGRGWSDGGDPSCADADPDAGTGSANKQAKNK